MRCPLLAFVLFVLGPSINLAVDSAGVNLAHLDWLARTLPGRTGGTVLTWAIYAEPARAGDREGPYRRVDAPGEGFACIDDVARAALVYLSHHELTGSPASLRRAREALRFVRSMAAGDGSYWNFVDRNGRVNEAGTTSRKGLGWWTARAFWALARAARVLSSREPVASRRYRLEAMRTVRLLECDRRARGAGDAVLFPAGTADVTAVFVLGLAELEETRPEPAVRLLLEACARGLAARREGGPGRFPFGAHPPGEVSTYWHAWGAHVLHALAQAGRVLGRADLISAARTEADALIVHAVVSGGPVCGFTPAPRAYPQIAYGVAAPVLGLLELERATGEARYGKLAALMASWLNGNNPAHTPMVDAATGRVWDGIDLDPRTGAAVASPNSGAESTIEGLLALLALARRPDLARYARALEIDARRAVLCEAESACSEGPLVPVTGEAFSGGRGLELSPGRRVRFEPRLPPGEYRVAPVFQRLRHERNERATVRLAWQGAEEVCEPKHPLPLAEWPTLEMGPLSTASYRAGRDGAGGAVTLEWAGAARQPLQVDCLVFQPRVEWRTFRVGDGLLALLRSFDEHPRRLRARGLSAPALVPAHGWVLQEDLVPFCQSGASPPNPDQGAAALGTRNDCGVQGRASPPVRSGAKLR